MAKIRSYYLSTINQELKYITSDSDPVELREMINQALESDYDDVEYYDESDHDNENDNSSAIFRSSNRVFISCHFFKL